jgi:hypothetical protein
MSHGGHFGGSGGGMRSSGGFHSSGSSFHGLSMGARSTSPSRTYSTTRSAGTRPSNMGSRSPNTGSRSPNTGSHSPQRGSGNTNTINNYGGGGYNTGAGLFLGTTLGLTTGLLLGESLAGGYGGGSNTTIIEQAPDSDYQQQDTQPQYTQQLAPVQPIQSGQPPLVAYTLQGAPIYATPQGQLFTYNSLGQPVSYDPRGL